jgi:hypothetical protein
MVDAVSQRYRPADIVSFKTEADLEKEIERLEPLQQDDSGKLNWNVKFSIRDLTKRLDELQKTRETKERAATDEAKRRYQAAVDAQTRSF